MTLADYQTQINATVETLHRHKRGARLAAKRLRDLKKRALSELPTRVAAEVLDLEACARG
jgi:hypothetical protein